MSGALRSGGSAGRAPRRRFAVRNPFRRRNALDMPAKAKFVSWVLLLLWSVVVLFPLYWLLVTSVKLQGQVDGGPFYLPFVDFKPHLDAWQYILVELGNDTLRPYVNTVVVGFTSAFIALILGSAAAYALVRFTYRPRIGIIGLFIGCLAFVVIASALGAPWQVAAVAGLAVFFVLAQTIGRRFKRALANSDIAFWLISQRILPPIAVVIPMFVLFQQVGLLDTLQALIVTYVATNIPIVVWLMRDYFAALPRELEESAAVDGASVYRIVRSIVLPISVPGLVATFLIVLIFAWNEFLIALILTSAKAQTMPLQVAAQNATRGPQWGPMSVLILIMIVPVVFMAIVLQRYISRGILVGALKG
jgi:multiple sugar transport system permease protein